MPMTMESMPMTIRINKIENENFLELIYEY